MTSAQQRLIDAQEKALSGKRIAKASDDPMGTSTVMRLSSLKSTLTQYQTNGKTATASLNASESTLDDLNTLSQQAYQLAVKAGNGTLDQTGLNGIATEISALQTRLEKLSNTTDPSGGYVFGGIETEKPPFVANNGTLQFQGSTTLRQAEIGADTTVPMGSSGSGIITDLYSKLESLKKSLTDGTVSGTVTQSIASLQEINDSVGLERARVGTQINQVETVSAQNLRRADELTTTISNTEEVDIAEALLNYQQAQTAYQASLNVVSQGFKNSLMDFIRG